MNSKLRLIIFTFLISLGTLLSGCNSTDDTTKTAKEETVEPAASKESKSMETTEPIRFEDGEAPEDFPWPVMDDWEARSFTTRLVEGEKNWNGRFFFETDAEEMSEAYKKVLEKDGFEVMVNDPEPVEAVASFSIIGKVGEQNHKGGMFFRTEDDGTHYVQTAVQESE